MEFGRRRCGCGCGFSISALNLHRDDERSQTNETTQQKRPRWSQRQAWQRQLISSGFCVIVCRTRSCQVWRVTDDLRHELAGFLIRSSANLGKYLHWWTWRLCWGSALSSLEYHWPNYWIWHEAPLYNSAEYMSATSKVCPEIRRTWLTWRHVVSVFSSQGAQNDRNESEHHQRWAGRNRVYTVGGCFSEASMR